MKQHKLQQALSRKYRSPITRHNLKAANNSTQIPWIKQKDSLSQLVRKLKNHQLAAKNNEQLLNNKFLKLIKSDFMYGVEEIWCNNQGVAILPYVIANNEWYYLLVKENNPLFKNKAISQYSTITGGLENNDPYLTVIQEMKEETGIDVTSNKVKIDYFGNNYANKSNTKLWYFFAIDLTALQLNLNATYQGIGDGSLAEQSISSNFITAAQLTICNDSLSLTIYGKLWQKINTKKEIEAEKIYELVNEYFDEDTIDQKLLNKQWLTEIEQAQWDSWDKDLTNELKAIDEATLIVSATSPLANELKVQATQNTKELLFSNSKKKSNQLVNNEPTGNNSQQNYQI